MEEIQSGYITNDRTRGERRRGSFSGHSEDVEILSWEVSLILLCTRQFIKINQFHRGVESVGVKTK